MMVLMQGSSINLSPTLPTMQCIHILIDLNIWLNLARLLFTCLSPQQTHQCTMGCLFTKASVYALGKTCFFWLGEFMWECVYLFADASASINTHHPEAQWFRELLTLLGDLQSQLSGWSHDYSCDKSMKAGWEQRIFSICYHFEQ